MTHRFRTAGAAVLAALLVSVPVQASPAIAFDSAVFVEKLAPGNVRRLEPAQAMARGDRVVTIVSWYRVGGNGAFTVTNPLPRGLYYQDSANGEEEVSVDGGRTWGKLPALRIGNRMATPEDVTHVRWRITASRAARGSGHITYSGIVR